MDHNMNLLETKFSVNHIYRLNAVARNDLFTILNDSVNSKLTVINAPAGYGKTTLLSSWITMCKKRSLYAAWLTLDEADNDETRFWVYFVSAINAVIPGIGEKSANLLKSARAGSMEIVITVLINEIQDSNKKFLFIMEDLHVIMNEQILRGLKFFINHMPHNIHLIMTSRKSILPQLSGIKLSDRIIEIGQEDLKFTKQETADFIKEVMELNVTEKELVKLYEWTEGWPVGLQIAALSCKQKGIEVIQDKKDRMFQSDFVDFFMEDVLCSQSPVISEFLLKTSLLDVFSCDLCNYVTGRSDCGIIIDQVLERKLFISCLDNRDNWYRYHSLFAAFLKKKVNEIHTDLAKEIYLKAGHWYEKKGYIQEAGSYYLKGQEYERAIILIEEASSDLIYRGQFAFLEKWLECIPVQYINKSLRLLLDYMWIYLSQYKLNDAKFYIEIIEKKLDKIDSTKDLALKGEYLIAKAYIMLDHLEESIQLLKASMELVDSFNPNYSAALMSLATSYIIHGDIVGAEEYFMKALTASKKIDNLYSAAYSWGSIGMIMTCQGRFSEAETLYQEAQDYLIEKGGKSIPLLGIIYSGRSEIYYMKNQIDKAYELSCKAVEMFEEARIFDIKNNCYIIKARALLAKGNKDQAIETINKVLSFSESDEVYGFKRHIEYSAARIFLDMDDLMKAEEFIEQYNLSYKDEIERYHLHDYIILAELLLKSEKYDQALICIDKLLKYDRIGRLYEVQLRMLKADALLSISEPKEAYDELHKALVYCAKENYERIFLNYGDRIRLVLQMFIDYGQESYDKRSLEYAKYIIGFFGKKHSKIENKSMILTKRELDVLQLISAGASNEEIAKTLFISVSTVKSHVLNISAKLGVKSRTKAVVEAEKRGIIHSKK